uniref:Uncharacterized protein n=1 Tax=Rhizophora mucronata TaxID=61149 RepID=A0A2P2Q4E7_RHIMU
MEIIFGLCFLKYYGCAIIKHFFSSLQIPILVLAILTHIFCEHSTHNNLIPYKFI